MRSLSPIFAVAVSATALSAQPKPRAAGAPAKPAAVNTEEAKYARRIEAMADSAIAATAFYSLELSLKTIEMAMLTSVAESAPHFVMIKDSAQQAESRLEKLLGDFDVVAPPTRLERAHAQLVTALRGALAGVDSLGGAAVICEYTHDIRRCQTRLVNASAEVVGAWNNCRDARERTAALVLENGITLAPLPTDHPARKRNEGG